MYKGLSFEQAPPLAVPFSFYTVASIMGAASGIVVAFLPELGDPWQPLMFVIAHLFLLGFVGFVMIGSLFQMLPVLAGTPVARAGFHAAVLLALLSLGLISFVAGFWDWNWGGWRGLVIVLVAALIYFLFLLFGSLRKVKSDTPSIVGMKLAGASLFCVVGLGVIFLLAYSGLPLVELLRPYLTDTHVSWGVAGWIGFLIQGVFYQVIPMFFVTPPFSKRLIRVLMGVLFAALVGKSLLVLAGLLIPGLLLLVDLAMYISLFFGAAYSLWLSLQRKRKVRDYSLWLIRFGLASVIITIPLLVAPWTPVINVFAFQVSILFGVTSIVLGMLFKIVPFLVWFHLQAQSMAALVSGRTVVIPTMKEIVPDEWIQVQIGLHFAVLVTYLWGFWTPMTWPLAIAVFSSFTFLFWVVARSWWRYLSVSTGADNATTSKQSP